jgi:hypothetical protein
MSIDIHACRAAVARPIFSSPRPRSAAAFVPVAAVALLALACGGEDATSVVAAPLAPPGNGPESNPGSDPSDVPAEVPDVPAPTPPAPLYVGATRVFSADSSNGYLFAVPSLGAEARVDLGQAVELSDAWVFGNGGPDFFTATLFEPTIKAWHVTSDGRFIEGPTVSFVNEGVTGTYTAASTPLFSEDKSYFVDPGSLQVVVWNPRDMTFIRSIELPTADLPGFSPLAELTVRDGRVLVNIFWQSEDNTRMGDFVRLVVIDPATDTIVEQNDDSRCGSFSPAGVASDGTTYYSPWDYHTVTRSVFGDGYGAASCGLRVIPAAGSLDSSYEVDLSALVGGRPAGSLSLLGDDQALLHVWHQELVGATPETWGDTRFAPGYKWYRWRIGSTEATELPDQAPSAEGSAWRLLDGKVISFANNAEYSETTLIELDATDHGRPGLAVPGWIVTMLRAY